jgi:hypothetical protein
MTNYLHMYQAGMRAFIPSRHHKRGPGGVWGRDQFRYLPDEDVYLCPAKKRMRRFTRRASTQRIGYRVEKGSCESCSFRERCTPSGGERTISRFFSHALIDEAEERVASVLGRRLLHERKVRSEGVFALAKELHGLRRTRFFGRRKVQVQLWLTAAAMNIKRAAKALRPLPAAVSAARVAVSSCPFFNFRPLTHLGKSDYRLSLLSLTLSTTHFGNRPSDNWTHLRGRKPER